MQEALQVAYRPMPPSQTVEYEEDFGSNMLIHREFVSKKYRQQMSFDLSAMAYSEVELRRGQQRLADAMNRERRGVLVGSGGTENDRVVFDADLGGDEQAGSVASARYLFNEKRMQYCDTFQEQLRRTVKAVDGLDSSKDDSEDSQVLFSLMEACAIIYGCDTHAAREAYYHMFYRLDLNTLEEDMEALEQRVADAAAVRDELAGPPLPEGERARDRSSTAPTRSRTGAASPVQQLIDGMPPLFEDPVSEAGEDREELPVAARAVLESGKLAGGTAAAAEVETREEDDPAVDAALAISESTAPLFRAYLAHARGEGPVPSHDVRTLVDSHDLAQRRRWRDLMERLVREDFGSLSRDDLRAAAKLNEQLHTMKFMNLKVGDTVKEIMGLLQRETGDGSSVDRDTPLQMSPTNPERRV